MSRLQLALNVTDIDAAVDFYSKLFATPPRKRQPGYANFAIADPPLKLVLFENPAAQGGSINHLGVEVDSTDEVGAATERFRAAGLPALVEEQTDCCFALQDKVWTDGPDRERWEFYVVHADTEVAVPASCTSEESSGGAVCCA
jgi:catechol 2,3-dioxygenase-like lactoylglutathione lyase family enzyme